MQMEIEVKGQRIKRINSPGSVEDTLNYLTCHFIFSGEEWDNTVKTAYFKNRATEKIYSSLIADDGTCTVPWEALTDKGFVEFSAAGERENYRITTGIESFYNSKTVYGGEPSEPPTPSQYDQLIALAEQTKEIAESVRRDADEGKFDGDPGEPGKPGAPGRDGVSPAAKVEQTDDGAVITVTDATGATTAKLKNGKDGNPGQDATDEQVRAAVEAYMEEHPIQADSDDIIKLAIKNEASGAVPIVVTDSADMGVQVLTMQGWTEQNRYEGKNLFDISKFQSGTTNINNGDGSITLTTYVVNINNKISDVLPDVKTGDVLYTSATNGTLVYIGGKISNINQNSSIEITESVLQNNTFGFYGSNNGEITISDITISKKHGEPYEPYTGGQPSPNPDYPQEIVSAGKYDEGMGKYEYEVKLTGANLFNPEKLTGGEIVEYNGVQCYKYIDNPTNFTYIDDFAENTQYCFSVIILSSEENEEKSTNIKIWYTDGTTTTIKVFHNQLANIVSSANKTVDKLTGNNSHSVTRYIDLSITTLGIGTEPVQYEPYKEQTITLTSDRPLTKWDKLEKRNGQWGWGYKSAEVVLDGTENYATGLKEYVSDFSSNCYTLISNMVSDGRTNAFMNRLSNIDYSWTQTDAIGFSKSLNQLHVRISNSDLGTTGESSASEITYAMKAYMAQQYEDGNPFIALYETAEETFVPLSESEREALNALRTYYPTTVLDNDQECDMALTYIADTKAYIDNKVSAIRAAIVNAI